MCRGRGDTVVATNVCRGVLCAGGSDCKRDRGVGRGENAVVVEVATQEFITRSNLYRYAKGV